MNKIKNKLGWNDYIIFALIIIKIVFFYLLIGFTKMSIVLGLITFVYFLTIFFVFLYSENRHSSKWFLISYTALTALMFADCVYYSYFNQLPSINQLAQMNALIVVDESVAFAMPPISILLFADIPLYYMFFKKAKRLIPSDSMIRFKPYKRIMVSGLLILLILSASNPLNADAIKAVNRTEFLTYHMYDFYTKIFGNKDNQIESDSDVIEVLARVEEDSEAQKNYQGIAKGRNLIVIQVESMQDFPINKTYNDQILTPNLNKLIEQDTFYFTNYFQNIGKGNTSDAEFSTQNSLYPVIEGGSYTSFEKNEFYGLPWLMRENDYMSVAYHGYEGDFWNRENAYVNQGFQDFISLEDFELTEKIGFGLSDTEMFRQTIDHLVTLPKPFYSFIITLTNHHPYIMPEQYQNIELLENDKDTMFGNYLQAINYTDMAIGGFIEALKQNELYEDSIIVIYGDHHGLNCKDAKIQESMSAYLGYPYDYDEMLNIPLLVHIPGADITETVSTVGGQVDFLPTICNLLDVELDNQFIFGRDLLNANEGFVASITYMLRGSFIKDGVMFEISREGIFDNSRAWDINTHEPIALDLLYPDYRKALNLVDASKYILENNLIENKSIDKPTVLE